jgi:cytosine/adenosine deaminase-related metal-dependent hydrolase
MHRDIPLFGYFNPYTGHTQTSVMEISKMLFNKDGGRRIPKLRGRSLNHELMGLVSLSILALALACSAPFAQSADLSSPPSNAAEFSIFSSAGTNGVMRHWLAGDGADVVQIELNLRGQNWQVEERTRTDATGSITEFSRKGQSPNGDVHETYQLVDGTARWQSPIDGGEIKATKPSFYLPTRIYPPDVVDGPEAIILKWLSQAHGEAPLLPSGTEHVRHLTRVTIGEGKDAQSLTLWEVLGVSSPPFFLWTDGRGGFFASFGFLDVISKGYEKWAPKLLSSQQKELATESARLSRSLAVVPAAPVVFRNVRVFADGDRWLANQTIVVVNGKIVQVGAADRVAAPGGAIVYDGRGKSLVPGLWDSHFHVMGDFMATSELALGVTSVRDPGNNNDLTIDRRRRRAEGNLLSPHVYPSYLLDGQSPYTAQLATVVHNQSEAIEAVDAAQAQGMVAIKLYGSFNPAWVNASAKEAHRLGLHVHGHLPAGMRPSEAIAAGYDELTHIYYVAMEAMPQEVVDRSNTSARFTGVGTYMKDVDLTREPMAGLIRSMATRHIYLDPTLVVAESVFVPSNGDLSPEYTSYIKMMPTADARNAMQGGFEPPSGVTRADFRMSFRKLVELVGALHQAGVPVVAGTDGSGLELIRELELYVRAGFTDTEALAAATIVPARLVGAASHTGSIKVGKDADLLLVDGDPSIDIGALRHVDAVMMDGKLVDPQKVREALGYFGKPE